MKRFFIVALLSACACMVLDAVAQVQPTVPILKDRVVQPGPRPIFPPRPNGAFACLTDRGMAARFGAPLPSLLGRDLSGSVSAGLRLTNDACRSSCASQGFEFAGTQSGSFCFCGHKIGAYGASTGCTDGCSGYSGEVCGGTLANSVSFSGALPFTPPPMPALPPGNGGVCVADVTGPGYRHVEIQQWTVNGMPTTDASGNRFYPMIWSVTGAGAKEEVSASGTHSQADIRSWSMSGGAAVSYRAATISTGLLFNQQSTFATAPFKETQSMYIDGVPQTPGTQSASWPEFPDSITLQPSPTLIAATQTFTVNDTNRYGYAQPPGASGTITCTWHVTR